MKLSESSRKTLTTMASMFYGVAAAYGYWAFFPTDSLPSQIIAAIFSLLVFGITSYYMYRGLISSTMKQDNDRQKTFTAEVKKKSDSWP